MQIRVYKHIITQTVNLCTPILRGRGHVAGNKYDTNQKDINKSVRDL